MLSSQGHIPTPRYWNHFQRHAKSLGIHSPPQAVYFTLLLLGLKFMLTLFICSKVMYWEHAEKWALNAGI